MSQERPIVSKEDLIEIERDRQLPYLKCIELVKLTPQHFGLNEWQSRFRIPDNWMKRIYRSDIYRDTDIDPRNQSFTFTEPQKKVLKNYLKEHEARYPSCQSISKSTRKRPPVDCLLHDLESDDGTEVSESDLNSTLSVILAPYEKTSQASALSESTSENVAVCHRHKIQPEEFIVRIAIGKMNELSPDQEKEFQNLIQDKEYMQLLDRYVREFLENMG